MQASSVSNRYVRAAQSSASSGVKPDSDWLKLVYIIDSHPSHLWSTVELYDKYKDICDTSTPCIGKKQGDVNCEKLLW